MHRTPLADQSPHTRPGPLLSAGTRGLRRQNPDRPERDTIKLNSASGRNDSLSNATIDKKQWKCWCV